MVRDPYARWCGRGSTARYSPIPIKVELADATAVTITYDSSLTDMGEVLKVAQAECHDLTDGAGHGSLTRRVQGGATPAGCVGYRLSRRREAPPMGYGVIGSPTVSGSVSLGSSPGTPARKHPS